MTTLAPNDHGTALTAPIVLPAPNVPALGRDGLAPAWAQLAAAIVATSLIWLAFDIALAGWVWAGLPLVVLAAAIFLGAVLPDLIAARWDRS
jgi:hypothetical protein